MSIRQLFSEKLDSGHAYGKGTVILNCPRLGSTSVGRYAKDDTDRFSAWRTPAN